MPANPSPDKLRSYDVLLSAGLAAATLVVMAAICLAAYYPLGNRFRDVQAQAGELRDLVERTSEIARKHQALEERLTKSRQAAAELLERMPAAPRESDFLAQVSQLAERTGIEVADYHPGPVEQRENHHEMEVRVSTRGAYDALCRFLEQVDRLPRLSRLTQLEILVPGATAAPASPTASAGANKLAVEMTYRIYFAPGAAATSLISAADVGKKG